MKFTKLFAAAMCLAAVATACQEPEESVTPNNGEGLEIAVSAQMYNFNKATDTAFEEGDEIGLHIVIPEGTHLENAKYTYTEGALVAAESYYWHKNESTEASVYAYYPYNASAKYGVAGYTFTVEADQSVEGGYAASDLLIASTASKPTTEVVALPFRHALSKVVINIESELEEAVESVMFADVYGSATINFANGNAAVNGQKGTIKAAKVADKESYTLIVVPQTEAQPRILVTVGDKQYNFNIEAATDFVAGKVATANIALTKNLVGTEFSAEITDWVGDSELQFNPSEENTPGEGGEGGEGGEPVDPETPVDPELPEEPEVFVPEKSQWSLIGGWEGDAWSDIYFYTTPTEGIVVAEDVVFKADAQGFLVRKPSTDWADKYGAANVNYLQTNKYITTVKEGGDLCVEKAGAYDIYFNVNSHIIYIMDVDADYTTATEQTENGKEPEVEEPETTEAVLYLAPNSNWKKDNARFAAYFFNNGGNVWASMTDADADGIYEVNIPVGYAAGDNVIFCRMNPATTANNWNNKWGQTGDLVIPTDGKNLYTINEGSWDAGTWSTK